MAQGLAVQRLINVSVNLSPIAAQGRNFNSCLVVGSSDVINVSERIRSFNTLEDVADAFGTTAPEYLAAVNFFSQVPQPIQLYIGRWAEEDTPPLLVGGPLSAAQQVLANWTAITTGAFKITVDAAEHAVAGLDFSGQTNLNGVAAIITAATSAYAICTWDGSRFTFTGVAPLGANTSIGYLATPVGGTDLSALLRGTLATGATPVGGVDAETPVEAIAILDDNQQQWYALTFAVADLIDNSALLAVAAYVQGASNKHIFGITTAEAAAITVGDSTSIGYLLKQAGYTRSFAQYSANAPYAVASLIGRGVTVNFSGNNTTITFMWKQEPGIVPEYLTSTQADCLNANNYDYFAWFNNDTAIIVNGKVASGAYIDEIWGLDWLANTVQTSVYNLLYTSQTKIPQTDSGNQLIANSINQALAAGVNNGLIAPGTWTQQGFGQLQTGDYLDTGYYIYTPPVALQLQADREARKSVLFQIAVKLAGAIHTVDVEIRVNR